MNELHIETRPWGHFEILAEGEGYKVKSIVVNPGQRLSLQSHKHREESWVIVKGCGTFTCQKTLDLCNRGMIVDLSLPALQIPLGFIHRMENIRKEPLIFIEVQRGPYLGEDDIIRYKDDYNRVEEEEILDDRGNWEYCDDGLGGKIKYWSTSPPPGTHYRGVNNTGL